MLDSRSGYLPLEDQDPSSSSEDNLDTKRSPDTNERRLLLTTRFTYWATVTVAVCTLVDLLVLLYLTVRLLPPVPLGVVPPELRSSYTTLDVLYSKGDVNRSYHAPIVNHAFSFAQVSLTGPEKVLATYHTRFFERRFGPVPLLERRLLITPEISTLAQFRAIDFGMESCSLAVGVPALNVTEGQVLSPPTFTLDVYTLPIRERLNLQAVSYASLPSTKTLFARLVLTEGTVVQTPNFPCPTLSYHTFLLGCSHPDCYLDLVRTTYDESGPFLYQYQTI